MRLGNETCDSIMKSDWRRSGPRSRRFASVIISVHVACRREGSIAAFGDNRYINTDEAAHTTAKKTKLAACACVWAATDTSTSDSVGSVVVYFRLQ